MLGRGHGVCNVFAIFCCLVLLFVEVLLLVLVLVLVLALVLLLLRFRELRGYPVGKSPVSADVSMLYLSCRMEDSRTTKINRILTK